MKENWLCNKKNADGDGWWWEERRWVVGCRKISVTQVELKRTHICWKFRCLQNGYRKKSIERKREEKTFFICFYLFVFRLPVQLFVRDARERWECFCYFSAYDEAWKWQMGRFPSPKCRWEANLSPFKIIGVFFLYLTDIHKMHHHHRYGVSGPVMTDMLMDGRKVLSVLCCLFWTLENNNCECWCRSIKWFSIVVFESFTLNPFHNLL